MQEIKFSFNSDLRFLKIVLKYQSRLDLVGNCLVTPLLTSMPQLSQSSYWHQYE